MIPVEDNLTVENCDVVEWGGIAYTSDTALTFNYVDSVLMVDSTLSLNIIVHHSTMTEYADTAVTGEGYEGYGFSISATELALLRGSLNEARETAVVLFDTLQTVFGCDSIVTLTLTFTANESIVEVEPESMSELKLYPNPTTSCTTVETEGLKHVELYDNEGRRLADYTDPSGNKLNIGVEHLPSGIYFLRIHTSERVTIQKLIKK